MHSTNSRRLFIAAACAAFYGAAQALCAQPANFLLILADDLGYGDLGCYGQRRIETPHLDRLAADGMRFTQHYAGSTVCAPSRCALMTGLHTGHCTVRGNVDVLIGENEATLPALLQRAGYATACIGKWGVGHPPPPEDPHRCGFDHFYGYLSMWHAHNAYPEFLWKNGERFPLRNIVMRPETHSKEGQAALVGAAEKRADFATELFTDDAIQWLGATERPFFLFMSYTIPHANNEAQALGKPGMEAPELGQYAEQGWPAAERQKAAAITFLDGEVGRLLERIDQLGLTGQTLVLFTSDNGPHTEGGVDPEFLDSNGPLRGIKRDLYEGGIRVPLIARWPGRVPAGTQSDHVSAFWDLLPTLCAIAGAQAPARTDGISFWPALQEREQPTHESLYWEFHEGSSKQTVRFGDWKAVRLSPSAPLELYDLATDVGEEHNVAADYPDVVQQAEAILRESRSGEEQWPLLEHAEEIDF